MNIVYILVLLLLTLYQGANLLAQNAESELIKNLLMEYVNPSVRPVRDHSDNVTVKIRLIITQVIELSERRQEVTLAGWYSLFWTDEFLTWDPTAYNNVSEVFMKQSELWFPDVTLYNNVNEEFEKIKTSLNVRVTHKGAVEFATPVILKSFCKMQLKYFPFDKQNCSLEFASWIYDGGQQDIIPDTGSEGKQTEFNENGAWSLINVEVHYTQEEYNCCPEVFPKVVYVMMLKRRERFFVELILLPCCLLSILTMFIFLLPPESGEKMSFGVSTLLAILLFQQMIAETLPPSADSTPILQVYFTMLTCMSCISIICTVLVLNICNQSNFIPAWLSKFTFGKFGNAIGRNNTSSSSFSRVSSKTKCTGRVAVISSNIDSPKATIYRNTRCMGPGIVYTSNELNLILKELKTYSNSKRKDSMENSLKDDWRSVAIFIDRIMFCFSFSAVVIVTVIVLVLISVQ